MLQFLRNNTKVVVWFSVILMVGVFGLSSISLRKHDQYAGEVFGKKISFQEFRAFETMTRLLPPSKKVTDDPRLEKQFTWQQLILSHEARNKGIEVSDAEVQNKVDQIVNPGETSRLSADEYFQLLKSRRTTPNEFENGVRELIRIQKLISSHFASTLPSAPKDTPAADSQQPAQKTADDTKQKQDDYVRWMTDIFQRSKTIDYSQINQKNYPPESSK